HSDSMWPQFFLSTSGLVSAVQSFRAVVAMYTTYVMFKSFIAMRHPFQFLVGAFLSMLRHLPSDSNWFFVGDVRGLCWAQTSRTLLGSARPTVALRISG